MTEQGLFRQAIQANDAALMREAFELMLHGDLSAAAEYETRHPDYIMEMPQSGERIRGRDAMLAMQEAYPTPPTITVRRVVGGNRTWVLEGVNDYAGDVWHVVAIFEFDADGRVLRDTRYYGQPFAARLASRLDRADLGLAVDAPAGLS